ncbi:MAG: hypothetical protein M3077_11530 [Candidatus Dormibacteraeota bacterium]|nr:hypothetical protein [Candidatus Dormibacteraeota bacterium]
MATAGTPVRLRPMPLGELLDESFKLYRRHFAVIAGVALAVILPSLVVTLISGSYRANSVTYIQQLIQNSNDPAALQALQARQPQFSPLYFLTFPIALLLLPLSLGAIYYAATSLAAGHTETVGSVLLGTLRRYFGILGIAILSGLPALGAILIVAIVVVIFIAAHANALAVAVGILAGIAALVFIVWLGVRWTLAYAVLLAERVGPGRALGRSFALVSGNWWRTAGILLLVGILVSIIQSAIGALFTGIAALVPGLSEDLRSGAVTVVAALVNAVVGAISPIAITMLYLDLRVRKEGVDLDQLARQTTPGTAPA